MIVLTAYALQRKKIVLRLYWVTAPYDRFSVSVQIFSAEMSKQLKRFSERSENVVFMPAVYILSNISTHSQKSWVIDYGFVLHIYLVSSFQRFPILQHVQSKSRWHLKDLYLTNVYFLKCVFIFSSKMRQKWSDCSLWNKSK